MSPALGLPIRDKGRWGQWCDWAIMVGPSHRFHHRWRGFIHEIEIQEFETLHPHFSRRVHSFQDFDHNLYSV